LRMIASCAPKWWNVAIVATPVGAGNSDHDANRIMISSLCLSMISAQTRSAFVARENRFPLFRIML